MDFSIGEGEKRFAQIIWECEPITSTELSKRALEVLEWKKSTSFTVLRRLCDKGIFQNEGGTVISLISKEAFFAHQSEQFVENTFGGSLPAFLAAFSSRKNLTQKEIDEIRRLIDTYGEK